MPCQFTIEFRGGAEDLLRRAKTKVEERRGTLSGDASAGDFRIPTPVGPIAGNYGIDGQDIRFEIRRRPMMVSCAMIEGRLREMLGTA